MVGKHGVLGGFRLVLCDKIMMGLCYSHVDLVFR